MEEKREPLSEMAIERKIQILRNKHMDSEVIALVKSDYEYGLTDDEIGLYLNKSYDIEQMKVLSKCLHKGVSEELLILLKENRMALAHREYQDLGYQGHYLKYVDAQDGKC